jgi:menaquinone-dependent protoporphyrinogen oxidase
MQDRSRIHKETAMSTSILIAYASRYGSTKEVADTVAETLRMSDLMVEVQPVKEVVTLDSYDAVVLGAPLYMFRLHKDARRFLSKHRETLAHVPTALFVLGPTHEPHDEQEWQDSWNQLNKELAKFAWFMPVALEVFGGKYDPAQLGFPIKLFIGDEPASDIRDWAEIRSWARDLATKLETVSS